MLFSECLPIYASSMDVSLVMKTSVLSRAMLQSNHHHQHTNQHSKFILAGCLSRCPPVSKHYYYYYYYRVLRAIYCQPIDAASSASCKRSRPPSNLVNGQELTMCDIVWISPQSHKFIVGETPFLVARITVALACPKTIQQ